ncbi:MAG TPA: four helix bundle protein [Vicinamibacterales bacterium]|nr:four helix bundle protein [Vicinamibacterales bacterium]
MDKTAEDLKTRTKQFASAVLEFVDTLPHTPAAETVARQLARAGTGVVGNYRSACRPRSHAEFTARMGIVADESDESELWMEVANQRQWGDQSLRASLLKESGELRAIFWQAYRTARGHERRSG